MNSKPEGKNDSIEDTVAAIVTQGNDLRKKISKVVMDSAEKVPTGKKGLMDLSRSVMDGAVAALDKSVSHDPDSVLRQVIDGLGDGLSTAALATRLAMEEARAEEKRFADEDLTKMTKDLRTVGELFVNTVSDAASRFKSITESEMSSLRRHAEKTMKRLLPSINSALVTIKEHPLQFGKESIEAGVNMTRQAFGSLFAAIGRQFEKASKQITGEESAK
jgi:Family of unknown function (DUF6781)